MQLTRTITEFEKRNLDTLISAVKSDRVCLISTFDLQEQQPATLICAVNYSPDAHESIEFIPLARLCDGNPYDRFMPPGGELPSLDQGTFPIEESS